MEYTALVPLTQVTVKISSKPVPLLEYLYVKKLDPRLLVVLPVTFIEAGKHNDIFGYILLGERVFALTPSTVKDFQHVAALLGFLKENEAVKCITEKESDLAFHPENLVIRITCKHHPLYTFKNRLDAPYVQLALPDSLPGDIRDMRNLMPVLNMSAQLFRDRPLLSVLDLYDSMRIFKAQYHTEDGKLYMPCLPRTSRTVFKQVRLKRYVETRRVEELLEHVACPEEKRSLFAHCLLYTSPSPRDKRQSRMPSSA